MLSVFGSTCADIHVFPDSCFFFKEKQEIKDGTPPPALKLGLTPWGCSGIPYQVHTMTKYCCGFFRFLKICNACLLNFYFIFIFSFSRQVQRASARAAEERYRKELEAHAGAITALRHAEDAQDVSFPTHLTSPHRNPCVLPQW